MSQLSNGCNSFHVVAVSQIPRKKRRVGSSVFVNGVKSITFKEEEIVDYGCISDYRLEDLLANGIKPSPISTVSPSRIGSGSEFESMSRIAEDILNENPPSNN